MPGPVPKHSSERRRRNKTSQAETIKLPGARVPAPRAKTTWHQTMKDWYAALSKSAQAQYYEPSDWAEARLWCDVMSRSLSSPKPVSAHLLAAFSAFSTRLLTTEGDRRRVRLEIERGQVVPTPVTSLASFRTRAGA